MPVPDTTGDTQDADLRDQLAKAIRAAVQLRIGPNAREVIERGGSMPLTPAEAKDAADAALAVFDEVALDRMADQLMEQTRLRSMDFRNGFDMDVEPARELAAIWVACARAMLGDSENYSETPVEFEVGLGVDPDNPKPREKYALIVQRVGKLTPHQARQAAEERAVHAESALARVKHVSHLHLEEHPLPVDGCTACEFAVAIWPEMGRLVGKPSSAEGAAEALPGQEAIDVPSH